MVIKVYGNITELIYNNLLSADICSIYNNRFWRIRGSTTNAQQAGTAHEFHFVIV
jgi:hypothetical protein